MLDYFVQQDCNLTQIGGLLDSKVSSSDDLTWLDSVETIVESFYQGGK